MTTKSKGTPRRTSSPRPAAGNPVTTTSKTATNRDHSTIIHFSDKMTGALVNISNVIDENKSTLDSIQDMAIELTRAIGSLRVVIMRYVALADNILETIVPIMDKLPLVPEKIKDVARDALDLSNKITAASELAEKVLPGVEKSLMSADISGLQSSTGDVAKLTRSLQAIIPNS